MGRPSSAGRRPSSVPPPSLLCARARPLDRGERWGLTGGVLCGLRSLRGNPLLLPALSLGKDAIYHRHYETEAKFVPSFKAFTALLPPPAAVDDDDDDAAPRPLDPALPAVELASPHASSSASFTSPASPLTAAADAAAAGEPQQKVGLFKLHYAMPFPLRPRTFVVGLLQTLDEARGELWTLTVPVDPPAAAAAMPAEGEAGEKGRVRASYTAVERVRRIGGAASGGGGDRIEWSCVLWGAPVGLASPAPLPPPPSACTSVRPTVPSTADNPFPPPGAATPTAPRLLGR